MKKQQNIIRKKSNYLTGLKNLSNWMFSPRKDRQELEHIIQKYDFDIQLFKRLVSYVYNTPHLIWYINKYLNDLYSFNKIDLADFMYTYVYLLDINQKNQAKKLFYLKSDDLADKNKIKIKNLLNEFFEKIYDKNYNDQELNFFYDLFSLGAITIEDINQIDHHLNDGKSSVELSEMISLPFYNKIEKPAASTIVLDIYRVLPDRIKEFCDSIKVKVQNREECRRCELYGKPTVILDTNMEDFGPVDIIFVGLNPGKDEVILDKPFVGKAGMLLREKMSKLPSDVKWVITNVILCHTNSEKDLKKPDQIIANCYDLVLEVVSKFPAKYYVPLGAKAASSMGINESITSVSGKKFVSNQDFAIIPLIHPSSAANYGQLDRFNQDFETIYNLFKEPAKSSIAMQPTAAATATKKVDSAAVQQNNKFITEVTPDLTLFDIREINNKIIKIFVDKDFNKKYLIEDYNFSFYVKTGDWKSCDQVTNSVDLQVVIPGEMKALITKKVRDKLNQIKEI